MILRGCVMETLKFWFLLDNNPFCRLPGNFRGLYEQSPLRVLGQRGFSLRQILESMLRLRKPLNALAHVRGVQGLGQILGMAF